MPAYDKCRYLWDWVSVKHRWRLSVDAAERSKLQGRHSAHGCSSWTIAVTHAR